MIRHIKSPCDDLGERLHRSPWGPPSVSLGSASRGDARLASHIEIRANWHGQRGADLLVRPQERKETE
jgi:hypothetical protein